MHPPSAATEPSPLRPAPPRSSTPLPGSFRLAQDPSTTTLDDGVVFLGGSPLRLFRFSERARGIIARWQQGEPVGSGRAPALLARRLVSAGAFAPIPDRGPYDRPDVTVVIPVRDRPSQLDRLLTCLEGLRCIVVDDASRDAAATSEICARHGAQFVGLTTNAGPGGARNRGLALAETPVVAFVDSDCVPPEDWLEPLLAHFEDPLVAAVAPRIVPAARDASAVGGPLRGGAIVLGPRHSTRSGAARVECALRAERCLRRADRGGRRARIVRSAIAERRGCRPGVAPGRGRLGRPLRAGRRRGPRRSGDDGCLSRPAALLRHLGRPTRPPARRRHGAAAGLGLVGRRLAARPPASTGVGHGRAGLVHRRAGPALARPCTRPGCRGDNDRRRRDGAGSSACVGRR